MKTSFANKNKLQCDSPSPALPRSLSFVSFFSFSFLSFFHSFFVTWKGTANPFGCNVSENISLRLKLCVPFLTILFFLFFFFFCFLTTFLTFHSKRKKERKKERKTKWGFFLPVLDNWHTYINQIISVPYFDFPHKTNSLSALPEATTTAAKSDHTVIF